MASKTDIVNDALAHLGEEATVTIDPNEASNAGRKVLRFLERARDAVLERHGWTEALEFTTLQLSGSLGSDWKYPYRFDRPGDDLRVWTVRISGTDTEPKWLAGVQKTPAEKRIIRCDSEGPLDVAYVRRIGWAMVPSYLEEAIGLELAARACQPINGSVERALELRKLAEAAIAQAMALNAGLSSAEVAAPSAPTFAELRAAAG